MHVVKWHRAEIYLIENYFTHGGVNIPTLEVAIVQKNNSVHGLRPLRVVHEVSSTQVYGDLAWQILIYLFLCILGSGYTIC